MADVLTAEQRSRVMSLIRGKDTEPELTLRRLVHSLGYRYRLHVRDLPGKPDLVFPSRRKVIFMHGCFWHRHRCRKGRSTPSSNAEFWRVKFEANRKRDRRSRRALRRAGWDVLTVWECHLKPGGLHALSRKVVTFLGERRRG